MICGPFQLRFKGKTELTLLWLPNSCEVGKRGIYEDELVEFH